MLFECITSTLYPQQHWVANNLFALSFSLSGIANISLAKFTNGAILLCGLFVYDVFWVFGTEVMVSVAKSFDAPVKGEGGRWMRKL